ncbi:TPA: DUF551 domain-containing protein [Escherichia coli]|nr:DUF551 domain-containing protein [Escherichia coli]
MSELYYPLRERYSPKPAPKCPVCGEEMSMQRISGSHVVYACSGMEDDGCFKTGRTYADEHYKNSRISVVDGSDPDVIELLDENVEMAITLEKLRVELEAAKKRVAELEAKPVSQTYKLTFEQWLEQQHDKIDVDCGCVSTEMFMHWIRVAYEAGNYPVTPDGWISCSERMPDKLIPVMVMYEDGEMWSAMWNGNRWDDGTEYPDPHSVTHWREMPAAPKQEVNRG